MECSNSESPNAKFIDLLVAHEVISSVQSDNGSQQCPGSESSCAQVGNLGLRSSIVHLSRERKIFDQVVLGRVENRNYRDEQEPMWKKSTLRCGRGKKRHEWKHGSSTILSSTILSQ